MEETIIRRIAGQRIFTALSGPEMDAQFVSLVKEHGIANVILFRHNIVSRGQLSSLCRGIQDLVYHETGHPALIAIDQEGGPVSRLPQGCAVFPSAMAIAATGKPENAYEAGRLTGLELKELGVNLNLAPVMDVNVNPQNPVIGVRSFGDTPEMVSAFGAQMIRGLMDAGILCAAKHFPGHGDTAVDSHVGLPCVDKSLEALSACELQSFRAAIAAGVPAVMTSHILYPQLEKEPVPATMSRRIITGLLKETLGFSGLVLSDCMMMGAVKDHFGTVAGTLAALAAGVDMVFISHSPALAGEAVKEVRAALRQGRLDLREAEASLQKILTVKEALTASSPLPKAVDEAARQCAAARMAREAATWVRLPSENPSMLGEMPLFIGSPPVRVSNAASPEEAPFSFSVYLSEALGGEGLSISADPDEAEIRVILQRAPGHTCLVLGTQNAHRSQGQTALLKALAQTGIPLICVALRNPYDFMNLPAGVAALALYGYSEDSLRAAAEVLSGKLAALGRLPVKL